MRCVDLKVLVGKTVRSIGVNYSNNNIIFYCTNNKAYGMCLTSCSTSSVITECSYMFLGSYSKLLLGKQIKSVSCCIGHRSRTLGYCYSYGFFQLNLECFGSSISIGWKPKGGIRSDMELSLYELCSDNDVELFRNLLNRYY